MNKEQLITYIKEMELEESLSNILLELVEGAPEVNDQVLEAVADVLDLHADYCERAADLFEQEAQIYQDTADQLSTIDDDEYNEQITALKENQEKLLEELQAKLQSVNPEAAKQVSVPAPVVSQAVEPVPAPVDQIAVPAPTVEPVQPVPAVQELEEARKRLESLMTTPQQPQ